MKRILTVALVIAMIATLFCGAFAAEEKGSITINGASEENVYKIYRILVLESYDTTSGAYSYTVDPAWTGFFATEEAKVYVSVDDAGYATWINGENDESVAAFAKLALAYAQANGIQPVRSSNVDGEYTMTVDPETGKNLLKFSDLDLGYYLVDSTMGALCGLTTTNPNASINAKNGMPTLDKQVLEDSTEQWGDANSADIGQTVQFRVTINVHAGAQNYVLHDTMGTGLTFDKVTKIEHVVPGQATETLDAEDYTVITDELDDGCSFHIAFAQSFCDELETNDKIVIYYEAMLNENAEIAGQGNPNTAKLAFGEGYFTAEDTTYTSTYAFDLVKTDSQNKLLNGAGFRIYDAANGGNEIKVVLQADGTYRRAKDGEEGVTVMVTNGQVRVEGFDNGTYYLEEVITPAGYNQLTARQKFIIADANLDAIFNNGVFSTGSGVHVVNKTGSMLPETGGMGTFLFITFGTLVVLGTGVLLVTKKRMSNIQE